MLELRGTAAADKMKGKVQHPADAPTRVRGFRVDLGSRIGFKVYDGLGFRFWFTLTYHPSS